MQFSSLLFLIGVFLSSCTTAHSARTPEQVSQSVTPSSDYQLSLTPEKVPDGSMILVSLHFNKVPTVGVAELKGKFEEQSFPFFAAPERGENMYEAVFGVAHSHKPGIFSVEVTGGSINTKLSFEVVDGNYKSETLKVSNSKVNPSKKAMKRILREIKEINKVYTTFTPQRYWTGPFHFPIQSPVTSPFGTKRLYNGQLKNFHGGLDLKAPIGTPIHAAAPGVVILAKDLYYSGNTVMLDHGYGVISLYFHMSQIKVKVGQKVASDELLGLSGKTGRVTGPHLHWQTIIQKVKVNPMNFIEVLK